MATNTGTFSRRTSPATIGLRRVDYVGALASETLLCASDFTHHTLHYYTTFHVVNLAFAGEHLSDLFYGLYEWRRRDGRSPVPKLLIDSFFLRRCAKLHSQSGRCG
jgi:hypothetical protein